MIHITHKLRFIASALTVFVMAALFCTILTAASRGSETKGRKFYRETCRTCHTKGAKGGELTPLSKTQAQWRTYFQKATHANKTEPLNKIMTDDQLLDIQTFLINHAADSPQPETCGK
jgi:cytochrome c553